MKVIKNASIIVGDSILPNACLIFDDVIFAVETDCVSGEQDFEEIVDARGCFLSAGFIDIHFHGLAGLDTMDENRESLLRMSELLPQTGVTSFVPTTLTMPQKRIETALANISMAMRMAKGAEILGCHLEGPFINPAAAGAHMAAQIVGLDFAKVAPYADVIRIVTLAPEMLGSADLVRECRRHSIVVSVGHTKASYEEALTAVDNGATLFTHLFNAMPPLHHRYPGAVGAALDSDAYAELIADNVHLHPAIQRMALRAKGVDRIILVTDSTMACLPEGVYSLGGQEVLVSSDAARLRDNTLAGSVLALNQAVKNIAKNTGLSLAKAVSLATSNPAKLLNVDRQKGRLAQGKDADLTVFDADLNIYYTYAKGRQVYRRSQHAHPHS